MRCDWKRITSTDTVPVTNDGKPTGFKVNVPLYERSCCDSTYAGFDTIFMKSCHECGGDMYGHIWEGLGCY